MKKYNGDMMDLAGKYAAELVKIKLLNRTSNGTGIASGVALLASIIASFATGLGWVIMPLALLFAVIPCAILSIGSRIFLNKTYDNVKDDNMSRKELKKGLKSKEMKGCLKQIVEEGYKSDVQQIEGLHNVLNSKSGTFKTGNGLVESVRREIYGKDAKEQKQNVNRR